MKVLFIGGTGIISSACSQLALERGMDLYLLNRGQSNRPIPAGARVIQGNIREPDTIRGLIAQEHFDAVVDWVAYTPDQVK
ncbi:MAG: NAD-dependent epimerase/dehydratase family protein, partial [Anaerolineaceae bacterium]|nr:NAD-dependent epimerase/dehydratase family protein [Anaerolineaceae bacterium]